MSLAKERALPWAIWARTFSPDEHSLILAFREVETSRARPCQLPPPTRPQRNLCNSHSRNLGKGGILYYSLGVFFPEVKSTAASSGLQFSFQLLLIKLGELENQDEWRHFNELVHPEQAKVSYSCKLRERAVRHACSAMDGRMDGQSERQTACRHACSVHGHYARSQGCTVKVRFEKETS